jgi:hypothetical protein
MRFSIRGSPPSDVQGEPIDPTRFDDPIARKTKWNPMEHGGSSFGTRSLQAIGPHRLEFRATRAYFLLGGSFTAVGLLFAGTAIAVFAAKGELTIDAASGLVCPLSFSAGLLVIGLVALLAGKVPQVFDRQVGYYWIGGAPPGHPIAANVGHTSQGTSSIDSNGVRLDSIHALQLIQERCSSGSGSRKTHYFSYELNLVFRNGGRLNVIDHGNLELLRRDAQSLAQFLGRPLWDATR